MLEHTMRLLFTRNEKVRELAIKILIEAKSNSGFEVKKYKEFCANNNVEVHQYEYVLHILKEEVLLIKDKGKYILPNVSVLATDLANEWKVLLKSVK